MQLRSLILRGYRPTSAADAVSGRGRRFHVTFDDAYRNVASLLPVFERLGVQATVFACSGYADTGRPLAVPELAADAEATPHELATTDWDGLRELAERGIEIGSHTVTHPHLPQLEVEAIQRELVESRERIEAELRRPCRYLAYPYGESDERVREAARRAGYEAAYSLRAPGPERDLFALPRVDLYRRDGLARAIVKTSPLLRRVLRS